MAGFTLRPIVWAALVVASSCSLDVAQNSHTGTDGTMKGAKPIELVNGEGKAHGIVTYPGGDRIDWKSVETPAADKPGDRGTLAFRLSWVSPRPRERLKFDVFDEWGHVQAASMRVDGEATTRSQQAVLANAKGKYFVRIYAVNRADAGTYHMTVDWTPTVIDNGSDVSIQVPVSLPSIPGAPDPECDPYKFDRNNPKCHDSCPKDGTPVGSDWPGCAKVCPAVPSVDIAACLAVMPCPVDHPDRRIAHCKGATGMKCKDTKHPDPNNPNCPASAPAVIARITSVDILNEATPRSQIKVIAASADVPAQMADYEGWTLEVIDANSKVIHGVVTLKHVAKDADRIYITAEVPMTKERLQGAQLKLAPPPVQQ